MGHHDLASVSGGWPQAVSEVHFPDTMRLAGFVHHHLHHDGPALESVDHGLNPLKPGAKTNLSSFPLGIADILLQAQKANQYSRTLQVRRERKDPKPDQCNLPSHSSAGTAGYLEIRKSTYVTKHAHFVKHLKVDYYSPLGPCPRKRMLFTCANATVFLFISQKES